MFNNHYIVFHHNATKWFSLILICLFVTCAGMLVFAPSSLAEEDKSENLILNPGFEELEDGIPVSWEANTSWMNNAITASTEAARTGNYGIRLATDGDTWIRQTVEVDENQTYEWSVWLKSMIPAGSVGRAQIKVEYYKDTLDRDGYLGDLNSEGISDTEGEWRNVNIQFQTPPETNLMQVYVRMREVGTAFYDDVSLSVIDEIAKKGLFISTNEKFYYDNMTEGKIYGTIHPDDGVYDDKRVDVQIYPEISGDPIVLEADLPAKKDFQYTFDPSLMDLQAPYKMEILLKTTEGEILYEKEETIYRWERPESLREDGAIMVDDKPFYPVIGYHVPVEDYGNVKGSINTIQGLEKNPHRYDFDMVQHSLDEAHKHGLKMMVPLYPDVWELEGPRGYDYVQEKVTMFKDHPAVLGWMIHDEPAKFIRRGHSSILEDLAEVYRITRSIDPVHPTYMVLNRAAEWEDEFVSFGKLTDIIVVDPYPLINPERPITVVGEEVSIAKQHFPHKPTWDLLQAFMIPDDPRYPYLPNITELRHMAYQAVLEGVQGLGYYSFTDPGWNLLKSELYPDIVRFTEEEIPLISDITLNGERIDSGQNEKVKWRLWENDGVLYAVVINLTREIQTATITLPDDKFHVEIIAPERVQYNIFDHELSLELSNLESKLIRLTPSALTSTIKTLVEHFADEGAFENDRVYHALMLHLIAVNHFEKQEATEKVINHMQGFLTLLEQQLAQNLISEQTYKELQDSSNRLIQRMVETLLEMSVKMDKKERVAGELLEVNVKLKNKGEEPMIAPVLAVNWPDAFDLDSAEETVHTLNPGETIDFTFEVMIPEHAHVGEFAVTAQWQFAYKNVEMSMASLDYIKILPIIHAKTLEEEIIVRGPGDYPMTMRITNNASESIHVSFEAETPEYLSVELNEVTIIEVGESIEVKGSVKISGGLIEGKHQIVIHPLVNGKRTRELPITVNFTSNFVENPGFEEGYLHPDGWHIQSTATWEWDQDEVHSGNYSVKLLPTEGSRNSSMINSINAIPVTVGKKYRVSFWAKNDSTNGGSLGIRRADARDAQIDYIWQDVDRESDWKYYTFTFEPTDETETVRIYLRLDFGANGQIWFDDLRFEEVAIDAQLSEEEITVRGPGDYPILVTLTNYTSDPIDISFESDAPEFLSLEWDEVTRIEAGESIEVEGLVKVTEGLLEGKHQVIMYPLVHDQRIQELSIIVNFSSNLVVNPGFEEGSTTPDGWHIQSTATWEWAQDEVHSGSYSIKLLPTVGSNRSSMINSLQKIPVTVGKSYRISFWAKNDSTNGGSLGIRRGDAADAQIDYIWHDVERQSDWTQYSFTFEPTDETESVRIYLRLDVGANGQIWFDDLRLEE